MSGHPIKRSFRSEGPCGNDINICGLSYTNTRLTCGHLGALIPALSTLRPSHIALEKFEYFVISDWCLPLKHDGAARSRRLKCSEAKAEWSIHPRKASDAPRGTYCNQVNMKCFRQNSSPSSSADVSV
ncbi:hypothetical protein J6590_057788 [Homalodisca vitripennis]|nr:hypothetical protein J6590_057788 [Homalodisca vitripennis]